MIVNYEFLSRLVKAHEASVELDALKKLLIDEVKSSTSGPPTYRLGEYNITVRPTRYLSLYVEITKAVTIEPPSEPAVDVRNYGAYGSACSAQKPDLNELPEKTAWRTWPEIQAISKALDLLESSFTWQNSPDGHDYWRNLCIQLRQKIGRQTTAS